MYTGIPEYALRYPRVLACAYILVLFSQDVDRYASAAAFGTYSGTYVPGMLLIEQAALIKKQ